ncbi:MAG: energy transducer TonB [Cetobacterium sp.]
MNKFYIFSLFIHAIFFLVLLNHPKVEEKKVISKKETSITFKNNKPKKAELENKSESNKEVTEIQEVPQFKERIEEAPKIIQKTELKKLSPKKNKILKEKKSENNKVVQKKESRIKVEKYDEFTDKNKFTSDVDGTLTALFSEGIEFHILKEVEPKYPIRAKKMGYNKTCKINVQFTVNLRGEIENLKFISGEEGYGFKEEVFKALYLWKIKPITYKNKKIKIKVEKEFIFK